MKTPEEIDIVFATTLTKLPAYIDRVRVRRARESAPTSLRVLLDNVLVYDYCHGVCGWVPWESSAGHSDPRARNAVRRAMRAAMKVHP